MNSQFRLQNIDPKIRKAVALLNEKERATVFSCQGHNPDYLGYIKFEPSFFWKEIKNIQKIVSIFLAERIYTFHEAWISEVDCILWWKIKPEEGESVEKIEEIIRRVYGKE